MLLRLLPLMVLMLIGSIASNAYAHTSDIVFGYKIEIGWLVEPPTVGMKNGIEIFITEATKLDLQLLERSHEDSSEDEAHDHSSHDHGTESIDQDHAHEDTTTKTIEVDAGHDHSSHDHDTTMTVNTNLGLQSVEQPIYTLLQKWKGNEMSPSDAIEAMRLIMLVNDKEVRKYESVQKVQEVVNNVLVWKKPYYEALPEIEKIFEKRIEEINKVETEDVKTMEPEELETLEFAGVIQKDNLLLDATEKSIDDIIVKWEKGEFSEYKGIREIQLILHANKETINDYASLQKIQNAVNEVVTGKKYYYIGMHDIRKIIDERIDELKNPPVEPIVTEIEEPVAISGLADKIEVNVKIDDVKTFLILKEDPDFPGRYIGEFTPLTDGVPFVNVFLGTYGDQEVEVLFHPESVDSKLST